MHALRAQQFLQRAVVREQAQRLLRRAGQQLFQVFDQGAVGLPSASMPGRPARACRP
jgi:hypothetical protein